MIKVKKNQNKLKIYKTKNKKNDVSLNKNSCITNHIILVFFTTVLGGSNVIYEGLLRDMFLKFFHCHHREYNNDYLFFPLSLI